MSMNIPHTKTVATIHLYSTRSVVRRALAAAVMPCASCPNRRSGATTAAGSPGHQCPLVPRARQARQQVDRLGIVPDQRPTLVLLDRRDDLAGPPLSRCARRL